MRKADNLKPSINTVVTCKEESGCQLDVRNIERGNELSEPQKQVKHCQFHLANAAESFKISPIYKPHTKGLP